MSYSITIKTPEIHLGGFFSEFWRILASDKQSAEAQIKKLLLDFARTGHEDLTGRHYENQTGQLERATKVDGSFNIGDEIRLYVDRTQVDYAQYVIHPNGKWTGDPFIDESIEHNLPAINQIIKDLYNTAVEKFNALP